MTEDQIVSLIDAAASLYVRQSALDQKTGAFLRIGVKMDYLNLAVEYAQEAEAHRLDRKMLDKEIRELQGR